MCCEVKYGMGRHVENVTPEEAIEQLKVGVPTSSSTTISS